jgi:hypothetical protein
MWIFVFSDHVGALVEDVDITLAGEELGGIA